MGKDPAKRGNFVSYIALGVKPGKDSVGSEPSRAYLPAAEASKITRTGIYEASFSLSQRDGNTVLRLESVSDCKGEVSLPSGIPSKV